MSKKIVILVIVVLVVSVLLFYPIEKDEEIVELPFGIFEARVTGTARDGSIVSFSDSNPLSWIISNDEVTSMTCTLYVTATTDEYNEVELDLSNVMYFSKIMKEGSGFGGSDGYGDNSIIIPTGIETVILVITDNFESDYEGYQNVVYGDYTSQFLIFGDVNYRGVGETSWTEEYLELSIKDGITIAYEYDPSCGDNICNGDETWITCPIDCECSLNTKIGDLSFIDNDPNIEYRENSKIGGHDWYNMAPDNSWSDWYWFYPGYDSGTNLPPNDHLECGEDNVFYVNVYVTGTQKVFGSCKITDPTGSSFYADAYDADYNDYGKTVSGLAQLYFSTDNIGMDFASNTQEYDIQFKIWTEGTGSCKGTLYAIQINTNDNIEHVGFYYCYETGSGFTSWEPVTEGLQLDCGIDYWFFTSHHMYGPHEVSVELHMQVIQDTSTLTTLSQRDMNTAGYYVNGDTAPDGYFIIMWEPYSGIFTNGNYIVLLVENGV